MRFWIKSAPPLIVRKGYADSMTEIMEWIENVIKDTKKEYSKSKKKFPPKEHFDIFKKCFVLLKVDTDKHPDTFETLGVTPSSKEHKKRIHKKFSNLCKEWNRIANFPKKKLGRRKKIAI